jgi:predicted lipid-binding transport protein (Tim44 family)
MMTMSDYDDEEEERRKQKEEQKGMSPVDRAVGRPPCKTKSGHPDGRSRRRTGRIMQIPIRATLRAKAMLDAIIERDNIASQAAFLEKALEAYQAVNGPLDESDIPSEEELLSRFERERDKRDAE